MKLADVQVKPGEKYGRIDLAKLVGKKILRVEGSVSSEFGDPLVFKLSCIVFEDGSSEYCEGEHDMPYIPAGELLTEETMQELFAEENGEDE